MSFGRWRTILAIAVLTAAPSPARADAIFNVRLDTASLAVPGSTDPFGLFFQLTDGSGAGDGSTTVTLSQFDLGGGSLDLGASVFDGGVSGSLSTALTLTDTAFFSFFAQSFTPGSLLSFLVTITNGVSGELAPDALAFSLLDATGAAIPTLDPTGAETLLSVYMDAATPTPIAYGADPARTSLALDKADLTPVPEPGTLLLAAAGLGLAAAFRRRRQA